ncbi:MAG: alginate lyase family protein [Rhodospirillales bacterium]
MNNLPATYKQRSLLKYAMSLSPSSAAVKGARFLRRIVSGFARQAVDYFRSTYDQPPAGGLPNRYVPTIDPSWLDPAAIGGLGRRYLEHRFGLLGSKWVQVAHGMECRGFAGHRYRPRAMTPGGGRGFILGRLSPGNRAHARVLWDMVDGAYKPIDWQIDFKSGYRWNEGRSSAALLYGHLPGVDVKVPWELARLQHLPRLALAYILAINAKDGEAGEGFEPPDVYLNEFRNQVMDFAASNPPRFGVNWMCTMDVAIRTANMVLAMDLFRRHGARFDDGFLGVFAATISSHARHIAANPEWHANFNSNHYLAGLAGLLFAAAYLPSSGESDGWLGFAAKELATQVEGQFTSDGANFEGSTSYHRLSAEIAVYATALAIGIPDERKLSAGLEAFAPSHFERLEKMAEFSMHITKPNGRVAQIGDNDSGRFFKLSPSLEGGVSLDHRPLVGAINGLFGRPDFASFAGHQCRLETELVKGLAGGAGIAGYLEPGQEPGALGRTVSQTMEERPGGPKSQRRIVIELPDRGVLDGLVGAAYPGFGLYIWRSDRFFMSIRCGPVGQSGNGGHAHNDQLAMELNIDGEDWLADPGSYVYTPSPEERDAYRSVRAHASPRHGDREPGRMDLGMFTLGDQAKAKCLRFDVGGFLGVHFGYGTPVFRAAAIGEGRIEIIDGLGACVPDASADCENLTATNADELKALFPTDVVFSPGYGRLEES